MIQAASIIAERDNKKCPYGQCEHTFQNYGEEFHYEGLCWKVTQPELENVNNNKKYCQCKQQIGFIRRYALTGYVEPSVDDLMITKECFKCQKTLLIRKDEKFCSSCRSTDTYK